MESYQRQRSQPPSPVAGADSAIDAATGFLRRLIPFPGADLPAVAPPPLPSPIGVLPSDPAGLARDVVGQQAASIVSQAASILDEEMARGVLAASGVAPSPGRADAANPLLRQAHEFVDNLARLWPGLPGAVSPAAATPPSAAADAVPEVGPRASVKAGQRATISMTVRNRESRTVRIVPVATDLIGSRGGRIASSLLEFSPPELGLEPGQETDLTISTVVPTDASPGCYSGLLVVRGIEYLRALITVDVA